MPIYLVPSTPDNNIFLGEFVPPEDTPPDSELILGEDLLLQGISYLDLTYTIEYKS